MVDSKRRTFTSLDQHAKHMTGELRIPDAKLKVSSAKCRVNLTGCSYEKGSRSSEVSAIRVLGRDYEVQSPQAGFQIAASTWIRDVNDSEKQRKTNPEYNSTKVQVLTTNTTRCTHGNYDC